MRPTGRHQGSQGGGKSAVEMTADEREWRDSQPTTTSCALCRWTYVGLAGDGRERAAAHRKKKHPELARKKRTVRKRAHYRITG